MTSSRLALLAAMAAALACGGGSRPSAATSGPGPGPGPAPASGDNVLPVSVNGVQCGSGATYLNQPCVSVTVCEPGTQNCQTIDRILLDTGSFGLRLTGSALTVTLPQAPAPGGGALAECVRFGDMTVDWGPVKIADVVLAGEPAVRVPVHVFDSTFGVVPSSCPNPEKAPSWGNGILGVGAFVEDCGSTCPAQANLYFSWNGSTTTSVAVDASSQVQNPVALLPVDNNGVIVALPGVPTAGARSVEGSVVLGIGTRADNVPAQVSPLALDRFGEFTTTLAGASPTPGSFADTGSNGLFFAPPSRVPSCSDFTAWYCPPFALTYSGAIAPSAGYAGAAHQLSLELDNFDALVRQAAGNSVFPGIGGSALANAGFDWGLPFFLGRTVYLGFDGRSSTLGPGPALAF